MPSTSLNVSSLVTKAPIFASQLSELKLQLNSGDRWYPYGTLSNLYHLDALLSDGHRDLEQLTRRLPVADIGAADGDMAFFLASCGLEVDIIDWGPTNFNGLDGARLLAAHQAFPVTVHEVNLDDQFVLPREHYGLVVFLGTLYHLKNPFYILERLSRHAEHMLVSTRIAATTPDANTMLRDIPLMYLVGPNELNDDPTNYWIPSIAGLRRLVHRSGWQILDEISLGCTDGTSNPSSMDKDERAFMLLRSANVSQV